MDFVNTSIPKSAVAVGNSRCLKLGQVEIGLFHTEDGFFALNNICPHRGAPLHDGFVAEGRVACPWHQWDFDLKNGNCRNIPNARVASYPVEIREGTVWIKPTDEGGKFNEIGL